MVQAINVSVSMMPRHGEERLSDIAAKPYRLAILHLGDCSFFQLLDWQVYILNLICLPMTLPR